MSWSRLAAALGALALAGCGFQPLYGDRADAPALAPRLAAIRVMQVSDRPGQELTNELRDGLNPDALSVPAAYQLEIALSKQVTAQAVRQDNTASRSDTTVSAAWILRRLSDKKIVLQGHARSATGYDVLDNEYANVVSGNGDLDRAVRDVGEQIQTRLAAYLQTAS